MEVDMDPIYPAAIEHIRVMESRITRQKTAIERLTAQNEDTADAQRRLRLLGAALQEMRIQLAQLTPTTEQVAAPTWALPLVSAITGETRSSTAA